MKIIFDMDAASDDIIALIYLLCHFFINIQAITISGTGEAHGLQGAQNIAAICTYLGKPNIPVAYGSAKPCDEHGKPFPDWLRHLTDESLKNKNIPINPRRKLSANAVELIRKTLTENKEKITILATGPLTNIAEFIQKYPQLKSHIEKIVIMGGALKVPGNIQALDAHSSNKVAEWNIYADPKAAAIVFASGVPVTVVALDATNQIPMSAAFYNSLKNASTIHLKLIYLFLKDIVEAIGIQKFTHEFYLWDPLAAMIAIHPAMAKFQSFPVVMDVNSAQIKIVPAHAAAAHTIQAAMKIPQAKNTLNQFVREIQQNTVYASRQ